MSVCASCNKEIRVCEACGGLVCSDGCVDRADDGCTCEEGEFENEDDDEEEEW